MYEKMIFSLISKKQELPRSIKTKLNRYDEDSLVNVLKQIKRRYGFRPDHKELVDHALDTAKKYKRLRSNQTERLKKLLERQYGDILIKLDERNII